MSRGIIWCYTELMDEQVEVIDESGKILQVIAKKEAHEKGLLHKCVVAELIDSQGNWILTQPSAGRQDEGQFVSPVGGHVTAGETDEQALIRETQEEASITPKNFKLVGKAIFNREVIGRKENHQFLLYEIYTDEEPILSHEGVAFKKFSPEEIKRVYYEDPKQFGDAFVFVLENLYPHLL